MATAAPGTTSRLVTDGGVVGDEAADQRRGWGEGGERNGND
jgi:hypothetical protein